MPSNLPLFRRVKITKRNGYGAVAVGRASGNRINAMLGSWVGTCGSKRRVVATWGRVASCTAQVVGTEAR